MVSTSEEQDDVEPNDEQLKAAIEVLRTEAGTDPVRGQRLVEAHRAGYEREAIETVTGSWPVAGSLVDQRVARLDALLTALHADEAPPSPYELGVLYRITTTQAASLLRTYQARHSAAIRDRMRRLIASITPTPSGEDYLFNFNDKVTLNFAADTLQRQGLGKGLKVDPVALTLVVPTANQDHDGRDAAALLGPPPSAE